MDIIICVLTGQQQARIDFANSSNTAQHQAPLTD